ncbi:MAG: FadR family transcriptional regulator [Planctomycetota bacterium]|jgi:DNA-binding FadR family transcriptional regulator|nr:FadR family transcriptional regulator [Planctomycetota bacterium]
MKEPNIIPISSKTNVTMVFEQLEGFIREGFWEEGERLPSEFELCEKFNVGRSTIREALNVLKTRELVYTVPGLGTFVNKRGVLDAASLSSYIPNPKSEKDLLSIMELRMGMEPLGAALAARRTSKAQLRELERQHDLLLACDEPARFAEIDMTFHMQLTRANRNPLLENAMNLVKAFLLEQQILTSQEEWRRDKARKFHGPILEAIRSHDEFAAENIMREHMDDTYIYIKSVIDSSHSRSGRWRSRRDWEKEKKERGRPPAKRKTGSE